MTSPELTRDTAPATRRTLRDVPGPRGFPLIGNLLQIEQARVHLALERFCREHGDIFSFRLGPVRCLGIADPELAKLVLRERPHDFRRMKTMERTAREIGMHGVFSAEGDDWKRQRPLMMPAFREENLSRHFEMLRTITQRFLGLLEAAAESGEPVDILHHAMRYSVDVMAEVALGRDLNTVERGSDAFQRHFETIFPMLLRRTLSPFPYWRYLKLPADRALDRALAGARDAVQPLIERSRALLDSDPERRAAPRTLLEAMLVASEGDRLTDVEVLANVFTLLLGGEDTTANTLAWIVYFIAREPAVQRAVRDEADRVLGESATLPDHASLGQLRHLAAVVHETLRLKGPAPFVALSAARAVTLSDIEVPAGTPIFVLLRQIALQSPAFPDPERFDPQRWLAADSSAARAELARASMPFGAGPRVCPGRQLALLECALLISALVKRFDLELATTDDVRERFDFAMEPENLRVIVRARRA
jgi:cytochrome P450